MQTAKVCAIGHISIMTFGYRYITTNTKTVRSSTMHDEDIDETAYQQLG